MIEKEELKRMAQSPGFNADGTPISKPKLTKVQKSKVVADKVVGGILKRTVGKVGRFLGRRILGKVPETAVEGSYHDTKPTSELSQPKKVEPIIESKKDVEVDISVVEPLKYIKDVEVFEKHTNLVESDIEKAVFNGKASVDKKEEVTM